MDTSSDQSLERLIKLGFISHSRADAARQALRSAAPQPAPPGRENETSVIAAAPEPHPQVPDSRQHTPPGTSASPADDQVRAGQHLAEQSAWSLSLIRESHQTIHQHLGDLARECQNAAVSHTESLRSIHGAIQELRRAHEQIISRLNQSEKHGQ